jgi:hypothetical protein
MYDSLVFYYTLHVSVREKDHHVGHKQTNSKVCRYLTLNRLTLSSVECITTFIIIESTTQSIVKRYQLKLEN